jgi:FMN phosphatase YigB (HAD superfamily)
MLYNKKPEMILFDVGGTLFDDGKCNFREGLGALRKYALNPDVTDDDKLFSLCSEFMRETGSDYLSLSGAKLDMPLSAMLKYVTMNAGLHFDKSMYQLEELFDRFNSTRKLLDGITELLLLLKKLGIRTAVISNNAMSGESLSLAIKRWLPEAEFEFCLTSADILFAKPYKSIFETALKFAGTEAESCWYCGDSFVPDVCGSSGVGMSPVLIDKNSETPLCLQDDGKVEYMIINSWRALSEYLINAFGKDTV